jgi:hypothetical protein
MTNGARSLALAVAIAAFSSGCFDSIIDGPCATGYAVGESGHCVARIGDDARAGSDARPDAPIVPDASHVADAPSTHEDAAPDAPALVCTAPELMCAGACIDVASDPDNCGACDRVCASGICTAGHCEGGLAGHIVAIGHDYTSHNGAMRRLLGNAVALGANHDVGVARWRGVTSPAAVNGASAALAAGMAQLARPWHTVELGLVPSDAAFLGVDVLLVDAQVGDGDGLAAATTPWAAPLDRFLMRGGVVIVLEGAGGTSHRFAGAAGLYTVPAPIVTTAAAATVGAPADALAYHVLSPYLAETTSVAYAAGLPGAVVTTPAGTVAFHTTRY